MPGHKDRQFYNSQAHSVVTSFFRLLIVFPDVTAKLRDWLIHPERGNGHLLVSLSRLPGENGLDNPPVYLPCVYLFIHAYSFVLRVTQAYNTQSFNTLKIVSVEMLANYFPAGIQSWLFCLWQNIWSDFYCQIGCKQSSLSSFKVAQYAFKSSRPPNLLLSVCDQWWCVICQFSWEL